MDEQRPPAAPGRADRRRPAPAAVGDVLGRAAGIGAVVGALAGFLLMSWVEWDESRDLGEAALYGFPGLVAGCLLGPLFALPLAGALVLLRRLAAPSGR